MGDSLQAKVAAQAPRRRGLSPLQKAILLLALKGRIARDGGDTRTHDLFPPEIFAACFGWVARRPFLHEHGEFRNHAPWGQYYDRQEIGEKVYNCVHASVSRSLVRLQQRGLIEPMCYHEVSNAQGCDLTEQGKSLAATLSKET